MSAFAISLELPNELMNLHGSLERVTETMKKWAVNLGFRIKRGGGGSRWNRTYLRCSCHGKCARRSPGSSRLTRSVKCGCGFCIVLKLSDSEWKVSGSRLTHNHALFPAVTTDAEARRTALKKHVHLIQNLRRSGPNLSSGSVARVINAIEDTNCTGVDVSNIWRSYSGGWNEDFVILKELTLRTDLSCEMHIDDNSFVHFFWLIRSAVAWFAHFPFVILVDCTYKTNNFGLPLLLFTTVDNYGFSFILGGCLLPDESQESFERSLSFFSKTVGNETFQSIQMIATDEDRAECAAVEKIFPHSLHRLCMFHLKQNLSGKALKGTGRIMLKEIHADFAKWAMSPTEQIFEEEYQRLLHCEQYSSIQNVWEHLYCCKSHWGHPWIREYATLGIGTTGRSESSNSVIKRLVRSRSKLSDVVNATITLFESYKQGRIHAEMRHASTVPNEIDKCRFQCRSLIPDFFCRKCLKEYARAQVKDWICRGESDVWNVDIGPVKYIVTLRLSSPVSCTCGFYKTYLLPCAHIFCIFIKIERNLVESDILPMWKEKLFDIIPSGQPTAPTAHEHIPILPPRDHIEARSHQSKRSMAEEQSARLWVKMKRVRGLLENDIEAMKSLEEMVDEVIRSHISKDAMNPSIPHPPAARRHRGRPSTLRDQLSRTEDVNGSATGTRRRERSRRLPERYRDT